MNKKLVTKPGGYTPRQEWKLSFSGSLYNYYELSGPGTLVRLVQFQKITYDGLQLEANSPEGAFWFEEELLNRIRAQARLDLARQQKLADRLFAASFKSLMTLYMRHVLRNELAVCKDWTNDFDGVVRLRLLSNDTLIAMGGRVKEQPAYSINHPQHGAVVVNSIILIGQAQQYVIDFRPAPNERYRNRIHGPYELC
jgi:hypothetical protein